MNEVREHAPAFNYYKHGLHFCFIFCKYCFQTMCQKFQQHFQTISNLVKNVNNQLRVGFLFRGFRFSKRGVYHLNFLLLSFLVCGVLICILFIYTISISYVCVSGEELTLIESNHQIYDFSKLVMFKKRKHYEKRSFLISTNYSFIVIHVAAVST